MESLAPIQHSRTVRSRWRVLEKLCGGVTRPTFTSSGTGCTIHLTYPGHYSPVEAGQLGVVIGNLFFDNPGEQADRFRVRPGEGHKSQHDYRPDTVIRSWSTHTLGQILL